MTLLLCRELTLANAWLIVCSLLHMALSVTLVKSLGTIGGDKRLRSWLTQSCSHE